jgi:hypothetical protein
MNASLEQDQWEAGHDMFDVYSGYTRRHLSKIPDGYVPVPPAVIRNWVGFEMIDIKEDE